MTAEINDFVEEWSQLFKPNECKNIKRGIINIVKKQLTSLKPAFLPTISGMGSDLE